MQIFSPRNKTGVNADNRFFIYLGLLIVLLVSGYLLLGVDLVYAAGPSIEIVSGGTWSMPAAAVNTQTTNLWQISNNSGGSEDLKLYLNSGTSGVWQLTTTDTLVENRFDLKLTNASGTRIPIGLSNALLLLTMTRDVTYNLTLWFRTPPSQSVQEPHSFTLTLQASNWNYAGCPTKGGIVGANYNGLCWWVGNDHESCTAACSRIASVGCLTINNLEEKTICPQMTGFMNMIADDSPYYPGVYNSNYCAYCSDSYTEESTFTCESYSYGIKRCCPCDIR